MIFQFQQLAMAVAFIAAFYMALWSWPLWLGLLIAVVFAAQFLGDPVDRKR
ncbi:hypothetical protein HOQ56_gp36 [uncultured phage_MedDCM-OCT-S38-C3]|uniref:Uncharacterized protein n=1 Tax=uncultured phage_MedDCM-OCT-S38-C3 TaxID=2740803 RepID=A0A6S4P7X0_9CAUD|nr:hypothetical protein HOQ56_gp36 [uncultured phage_MedDCM-OCT-S38-C3]BAQ94461.1 hypothetical protein [uncultured phage_MedDCM-OCT-S38-C3]